MTHGSQWVQGDHSIFIQNGCPALALSSDWLIEHLDTHRITHSSEDNPDIVEPGKCVEIAEALTELITELDA
ncbi:MAG: hypothetical protein U5R06_01365 [candidate division KSB1 bacterium]|nr:hypothetical protein [candidate division KSB1 bacterium]